MKNVPGSLLPLLSLILVACATSPLGRDQLILFSQFAANAGLELVSAMAGEPTPTKQTLFGLL